MLIEFSVADVMRSKNLEAGWYSWAITNISPFRPNANNDGVNWDVTLSLIDKGPELDGKEIKRTFSSKAKGMMIPLVAACRGIPISEIKPENFSVDTDELIGKKLDGKATIEIYEGRPTTKVEEYLPYKKGQGQGVPF